ncbi:zinc finger and BTB domain-containing protein 7A-like isoform X4 [Homarus americanus]|uniref:zinc finger and BTB domain-containing protein 7A-like isoform X4 n=1 Tax=Homarus americanus TaxID=6706 RepID=UPI001C478B70|nr:zinc finger and BTB domain-containing protein 7A-like isoform X4 [Homarus americanus]
MAEGMLSLSWNNHRSTFCHMLSTLRDMERYTDVTVACEGKFYPAHKLVLSTCSDYFLKMFERTPCKHPIIVVKDVQCRDIEALLSYMYAGVVSVAQNDLAQLIKAAELLQIKGLAVPDEPPTTNKKSAHSRGSTDDRSSPHPKRQRREDNKSPSQNDGQTLCSAVSSPHSSPFRRDSEYSQEQTATIKHTNKGNQRVDQKLERRGDGIRADQLPEQHASQGIEDRMECPAVTKESPEAQVEMMDDSLVKEEILEPENDGDVSETGFEYGALVSNLMVDSGGGTKDQPNLSASSNFSHPPDDEPFVSQAGPSGLQGWSSLGDGGDASSQGYCGDLNQELSLQGLPGTQPQQTHHLVREDTGDEGTVRREVLGTLRNLTTTGKRHHCPYCNYTTDVSTCLMRHVRTHTGEKPFLCPYCPQRVTRKATLISHIHCHTGEKPLACRYCSYVCRQKSNMNRHMKKYHMIDVSDDDSVDITK